MKNPWSELPLAAPFVLPRDRSCIDAFNEWYGHKPRVQLQTQLLPQPFVGDPAAPVYLLALNPGYTPGNDEAQYADSNFADAARSNLTFEFNEYPFYFLNPAFAGLPGYDWSEKFAGRWISDFGRPALSRRIFLVELIAYHSTKFQAIPKRIDPDRLPPSSNFAADLVRQAIDAGKFIVMMRSFRRWEAIVPELSVYKRAYRVNSPLSAVVSPNNLPEYDVVTAALSE